MKEENFSITLVIIAIIAMVIAALNIVYGIMSIIIVDEMDAINNLALISEIKKLAAKAKI